MRNDLRAPSLAHQPGHDGRASWRQFIDHRHVEVGVKSHGQRARYRRRAHHQLVGFGQPLAAQRQALGDAEAVLLVDDRKPERRHFDTLLEERVRADGELRGAGRDGLAGGAALLRGLRTGQPGDAHRQAFEPRAQLAEVLLGQEFGGRHEGHRAPAFNRLQRRKRGDHRLAGAHVPLQEPLHRLPALQVVADFAPHFFLRPRELERNALEQRSRQRAGAGQHRCAPFGAGAAMHLHRQLLRQQLVELEARPRRMRTRVQGAQRQGAQARRRGVQEAHRVAELPQLATAKEILRQDFCGSRGVGVERTCNQLAQRILAQSGRGGIDRRQAIRQRCAFGHHRELRVHDFRAEVAFAYLSIDAHPVPRRQRLLLVGIEREEAQVELRPAFVIAQHAGKLAARTVLDVGA